MSSFDSTRPLSGEALLDAITDAVVAVHLRQHGRFPATAETVLVADDLVACTLGGIHVMPDAPGSDPRRTGGVDEHTFIDAVQRVSGRTVLAFISDYRAGPNLVVELFWLAPARRASPSLVGARTGRYA